MKIIDLINKGKEALLGRETAVLDAEVLLCNVLEVNREYLVAHRDEEVDKFECSLFCEYLKQMGGGKPIAYILGEKEFFGLNFFVDERVLIPRPETEHVVEKALDYLRANDENGRRFRLLDVGTGSGCIPISIAHGFFEAAAAEAGSLKGEIEQIDAVDISEGALEVAKVNISQYSFENLIHVFQSDLLEAVEEGEKYDLIVSNLPYIDEVDGPIEENVKKYEPHSALYGGERGLELYKKMFQQMREKGVGFEMMIGEFGFGQGEEMRELLDNFFDQNWSIEKDHAGIDRIFIVS
ncbi:MAG: peptide chain release factor N(5)-glutamine methyltransferase [Nitrospirae bacterium]|nr:peptide chain release factor N(5)-glutamine methyltransferase [Nitrospirota bacterium]